MNTSKDKTAIGLSKILTMAARVTGMTSSDTDSRFHARHLPPRFVRLLPKNASPHGTLVFASQEFVPVTRPDGIVVRMVQSHTFNEKRNQLKRMLGKGKTRRRLRKAFMQQALVSAQYQ